MTSDQQIKIYTAAQHLCHLRDKDEGRQVSETDKRCWFEKYKQELTARWEELEALRTAGLLK